MLLGSIYRVLLEESMGEVIGLGGALAKLSQDHSEWSQAQFGSDTEVGPIGPLRHLQKEAAEAEEDAICVQECAGGCGTASMKSNLKLELADCLLLLLDANRRAGFSLLDLIEAGKQKLEINKQRKWKKQQGEDQPLEHVD